MARPSNSVKTAIPPTFVFTNYVFPCYVVGDTGSHTTPYGGSLDCSPYTVHVEGVVCFVVAYPALVGLFGFATFLKDIKHLIGNIYIGIYAYMVIVIFQIYSFHGCTILSIFGFAEIERTAVENGNEGL